VRSKAYYEDLCRDAAQNSHTDRANARFIGKTGDTAARAQQAPFQRRLEAQDQDQDADRFLVATFGAARRGLRVSTDDRGRFCVGDWFATAIANCSLNASSS